jgi:hypothetical protein
VVEGHLVRAKGGALAAKHAESVLARGDVSAQSSTEASSIGEAEWKAGRAAPAK